MTKQFLILFFLLFSLKGFSEECRLTHFSQEHREELYKKIYKTAEEKLSIFIQEKDMEVSHYPFLKIEIGAKITRRWGDFSNILEFFPNIITKKGSHITGQAKPQPDPYNNNEYNSCYLFIHQKIERDGEGYPLRKKCQVKTLDYEFCKISLFNWSLDGHHIGDIEVYGKDELIYEFEMPLEEKNFNPGF